MLTLPPPPRRLAIPPTKPSSAVSPPPPSLGAFGPLLFGGESLLPDRPAPPMPINFVDGLGYTVNGEALGSAYSKVAWDWVEKIRGRGGDKVQHVFNVVFNQKLVEQQRADPSLPQRYQSRASKTEALAGTVFKKLITKLKEEMHDPFESVYPMPPGSVIVSGVVSGDPLAHTDTSTAPHVLPLFDWAKPDCHLCTFVALSPQ